MAGKVLFSISCRIFFLVKEVKSSFYGFYQKNFSYMTPTQYDFHRFFTYVFIFFTCRKIKGKKIGKNNFFPKITNFCCIALPLAKTYWMIVSPQKMVKKSLQFVPTKHSYIKQIFQKSLTPWGNLFVPW